MEREKMIFDDNIGVCTLCGKTKNLRPLGPDFSLVCCPCGMKDEQGVKKRLEIITKEILGQNQNSPLFTTHIGRCTICNRIGDLRPYGPDSSLICCPCGMKDERETIERIKKIANKNQIEGPKAEA